MTPRTTVTFHIPMSQSMKEELRQLFENQTGQRAQDIFLSYTHNLGSGTVWGFYNDVASLFFVEP